MTNIAMQRHIRNRSKRKLNSNLPYITIGARQKLSLQDIDSFILHSLKVQLSPESLQPMEQSHQFLKACIDNRMPIYGTNTNFGDQVNAIDPHLKDKDTTLYYESILRRQKNIIKSLSCGLGGIIPIDIIRVAMLLRAHCISQGYSGVTQHAVQSILEFINAGITPCVRQYGSIGASGDLIPLATIASAILGENVDVFFDNKIMKAPEAMASAGLKPFMPECRDGLAMINGTSFMTAIAGLSLYNLKRLFWQMMSAIAMSLESLLVITSAYEPLIHQVKGQDGQNSINEFMVNFWNGSQLISNIDDVMTDHSARRSIQDYYSLRAIPQGFGPFYENLKRSIVWVENEMNSVNDNPVIDCQRQAIHNGANFMGYYITDACDVLKMDIAQASTWIHALIANMVHPNKSHHLPANIVSNPEINNGFRSIQLLSAAIAVQNRKLAQSQQSFMLPTEGDNQDVNSLGVHAALDFKEAVMNLERLTALLLLAATQALEIRGIEKAGKKSQEIYHIIREYSPTLIDCRPMSDEINTIVNLFAEEWF